jgi:hypothetical protein
MPNIIGQINSETAQNVLSIPEIFYQFFFEHQDFFPECPNVLGRIEISFNLYNLPEIIRLHKIPIMARTNSSIQEKNSQEISTKCPIVFGKMGGKKIVSFPKLPKRFARFGHPFNVNGST